MTTSGSDLAEDLVEALKQALRAREARPYFYALIIKQPSGGQLMVSRRRIPNKDIAEVKKKAGSNVVIKGVCHGADGVLVFEAAAPPQLVWETAARRLAKEAGLKLHAEFRLGRDDEAVPDEPETAPGTPAEDGIAPAPQAAAPASGSAPSPNAELAMAFTARLKALLPRITAAAGSPDTAAAAAQARTQVEAAGRRVRDDGTRDWDGALALLDSAEATLDNAGQTLAQCTHRLSELLPAVRAANQPDLLQLARDAAALLQKKDLDAARQAIAALQSRLPPGTGQRVHDAGHGADDPQARRAWQQARQEWLDANGQLDAQLNALRTAILDHAKVEPELAASLSDIAEVGLGALTGNHRVRLMAALQGVGDGSAQSMRQQGAPALAAIAAFRTYLDGNEKVDACEGNPWDVDVSIRDALYPPLERMAALLQAHQAAA